MKDLEQDLAAHKAAFRERMEALQREQEAQRKASESIMDQVRGLADEFSIDPDKLVAASDRIVQLVRKAESARRDRPPASDIHREIEKLSKLLGSLSDDAKFYLDMGSARYLYNNFDISNVDLNALSLQRDIYHPIEVLQRACEASMEFNPRKTGSRLAFLIGIEFEIVDFDRAGTALPLKDSESGFLRRWINILLKASDVRSNARRVSREIIDRFR